MNCVMRTRLIGHLCVLSLPGRLGTDLRGFRSSLPPKGVANPLYSASS